MPPPEERVKIEPKDTNGSRTTLQLVFRPERYAQAYGEYLMSCDDFTARYSITISRRTVSIKQKNPENGKRYVPKMVKREDNGVTVWRLRGHRTDLWKATTKLWKKDYSSSHHRTTYFCLKRDWKTRDLHFLKPFIDRSSGNKTFVQPTLTPNVR